LAPASSTSPGENLKAKNGAGILTNLPSLGVIDDWAIVRCSWASFHDLGPGGGSVIAQASVGPAYFKDSKWFVGF